jgi:hypothetical protein
MDKPLSIILAGSRYSAENRWILNLGILLEILFIARINALKLKTNLRQMLCEAA